MTKYIWRQINIWFGVEDTRWVAWAVTTWVPKTDLSFEETNEVIQDESSIGVVVDSRDSFVVRRWGEWELGWNITTNAIGYLLYAVMWAIESDVDTVWAYKHDITFANTNLTPSLTVWVSDPVIWDIRYALWTVNSLTISAEEGQIATYTVNLMSKTWESTTHTVAYDPDNTLLSRHSIFRIAENLAWLDTADNVCLRSFEITFNRNVEPDYCIWDKEPKDFISQQFSIEWSFTAVFEADTFRTIQLDWEHKAVRFELKDTWTTIWADSNPTLKIDLPIVSFTEFSRTQGNDEVVIQTLTFKGLYSNVDWTVANIELVNTKEEYVNNSI